MSHKGVVRLLKSALPMIMLVMQIGMPIKVHENQLVPDPGETGPCTVEKMHLEYDGLGLDFFSPVDGTCSSWSNAPYPGLVFAHGFSMMGLTDGVADLSGYGEHLASWGYWLALPALPDDAETRISDLRKVLDRLLLESNQISSPIYKKIDPDRIAASGYSLGGATALAAAARDERITAVVALDPVYHEGGFQGEGEPIWNPEIEGKDILIPTGIIGSPPSECNAQADYEDIFSYLGAQHAAAYLLVGASHCDFLDPGNSYCPIFCSGTLSPARTKMSQRYLTAWLNYYLMLKEEYFAEIFGNELTQEISLGVIEAEIATEVKEFSGLGVGGGVILTWDLYEHPILRGQNIYRRESGKVYPGEPYTRLGMTDSYLDLQVKAGKEYYYKACSYDLGGNQHECSLEHAVIAQGSDPIFLPFATKR